MIVNDKLRSRTIDFLAENGGFDPNSINKLTDDDLCDFLIYLLDHIDIS